MKRLIKQAALSVLGARLPHRVLRMRALVGNPLTILCYHTLGADQGGVDVWTNLRVSDFRRQLAFLQQHYQIVSLDQALESDDSDQSTERPMAVLTFDDGDAGLFAHLLPLVQEMNVPVTVYVATGQIETGQPYWFDRVMNALQAPAETVIDLRDAGLSVWTVGPGFGAHRWQVISEILEALKTLPPEQREVISTRISDQSASNPDNPLKPMSVGQLQKLAACSYITIGAHSHCHNLLDQIPLEDALASAAKSRSLLQHWTGQDVCHFAYPNGNHNTALQAGLRELGFASATVLDMKRAERGANRFALARIAIGRYDDFRRFRLRLVGV